MIILSKNSANTNKVFGLMKMSFISCLFLFVLGCENRDPEECKGANGIAQGVNKSESPNDGEFVKYAYQVAMQRNADPQGLMHHCTLLKDGKVSRAMLIDSFVNSPEHQMLRSN